MLKTIKKKAKKLINYFNREKRFAELLAAEGWRKTSEFQFEFAGNYRFEKGDYILYHKVGQATELFYQFKKIKEYKQYLTQRDIGRIFYLTNTQTIKSQQSLLDEILARLDNNLDIQPNSELHKRLKAVNK
jgi:hypothetical protein